MLRLNLTLLTQEPTKFIYQNAKCESNLNTLDGLYCIPLTTVIQKLPKTRYNSEHTKSFKQSHLKIKQESGLKIKALPHDVKG